MPSSVCALRAQVSSILSAERRTDMMKCSMAGLVVATALIMSGCNNGGGGGNSSNGSLVALIAIPNVKGGTNFSFDISDVDSSKGRMYFTDRNNKSVDVIDI